MKRLFELFFMAILIALPTLAKDDIETSFRTALVMAYSPANNVYEDDNIKFEIYNESLWATNKTEKTIFLDLSQCFLTHNGSSYPMLSSEQDEKDASRKGASTSIDEFFSIAPAVGSKQNATFICNLAGILGYGEYTTSESPSGDFTEYDEKLITLINEMINESLDADPKGKNYVGTSYRHLTEDESVNNIGANIAYAFNKRSEEWTPVAISTWVSDIYFAPYYVEMPQDLKKKEKRGFGVKKTEAAIIHIKADSPFEYENEKSPITVYDWTGDFMEGTFKLNPIKVSKKKNVSLSKYLAELQTLGKVGYNSDEYIKKLHDIFRTYFKTYIHFDGQNDNWGKMKYFKNEDLSKFNNR